MTVHFERAPLVELIASLRWDVATVPVPATGGHGQVAQLPRPLVDPAAFDAFFHRFGGAIYQHGFKDVQRLLPAGVPLLDTMVYRYRRTAPADQSILVQLGANQLSVNALPPYQSWEGFVPWVERAADALFEALQEKESMRVSVRYIDAFRGDLLQGLNPTEFLRECLGFSVQLPDVLGSHASGMERAKASMQVEIPMEGMQMLIKAADGAMNGETAALLDTQVTLDEPVACDKDAVMAGFDRAHGVIHDSFLAIVKSIRESLGPTEEE